MTSPLLFNFHAALDTLQVFDISLFPVDSSTRCVEAFFIHLSSDLNRVQRYLKQLRI